MIPNINYYNLITSLLVPTKRVPRITTYNQALVSSTYNEHNIIFDYLKKGTMAPLWISGTSYQIGDIVRYGKSVFQNSVEDNLTQPTFDDTWVLISDNFIGTDERILFTGEKLTFEYALNKWFDTTFRNLPSISDIYIITNIKELSSFMIGYDDNESSLILKEDNASEIVLNNYETPLEFFNMIIHVPTSILSSLGTTLASQKNVVRKFADKYVNAGITYDIQSY